MNYLEYLNTWLKSELLQGKIMIGIGILLIPAFWAIIKSEHSLLKGTLIPLGLLLVVLIGYGSFMLYSRPAHAKAGMALYEKSETESLQTERAKHVNDNKAGNTLMKVYPILVIISMMPLFFNISDHYKGMGLGFAILFIALFIIDYGFVSRSNAFIAFLDSLTR